MSAEDLFYLSEASLEPLIGMSNNTLSLLQQGLPPNRYNDIKRTLDRLRTLQFYSNGGYFLLNKNKIRGPLVKCGQVIDLKYDNVPFNLINFDLLKPSFKVRIRQEFEEYADINVLTFTRLTLEPFIYSLWYNSVDNITATIPYTEFYNSLEEKAEAERPSDIRFLNSSSINLGDPIV